MTQTLADMFPDDLPGFLARTPHGYHQRQNIVADLAAAGFNEQPAIPTLARRSRAESPRLPAIAYCQERRFAVKSSACGIGPR